MAMKGHLDTTMYTTLYRIWIHFSSLKSSESSIVSR